MEIGSLGVPELLIILVVVLLLFGPRRLPEVARGLGQAVRGFREGLRSGLDDLEASMEATPPETASETASMTAPAAPSETPSETPSDRAAPDLPVEDAASGEGGKEPPAKAA